jgi:Na+/proline symporter
VVLYTAVGGLKATFLTDYLHTAIALILIIYFTLTTLTHEAVGGLGGLYDKIMATASENMIPRNYEGSLLTMKSVDAIIWGLILKFGNLALVVMVRMAHAENPGILITVVLIANSTSFTAQDTAFWQKSFATEVKATVPGYNIAAVAIFGIPWGLGTVIGLTARAIHNTPIFPTYPGEFSPSLVNAGLVMPYTIKALIGDKGIIAFFVLLFMALTSTVSSSMIAVSSIISFDLYKTYINPKATDKRLMKVSHLAVVFHTIFITGISLALNYGGADMTWIGYFRPILSCPGIIPLGLTLGWSKQTRLAAIASPILGFLTGLSVWLATAKSMYGTISIATTEASFPALYGAIASFFSPALYSVVISLYKPESFDWRRFLLIELAEAPKADESESSTTPSDDEKENKAETGPSESKGNGIVISESPSENTSVLASDAEKADAVRVRERQTVSLSASGDNNSLDLDNVQHPFTEETLQELRHWYRIAWAFFVVIVLVTFVAWPMPLYRNYIFTKSFFSSWTTVAIIWQFFAFFAVVVYPLYDGRHAIVKAFRGVWRAIGRKFNKA